jgi:hypothetical protein
LWKTAPASGTATVTINGGSLSTAAGDAFLISGETGNAATGAITVKGGAAITASAGNIINVTRSSKASFTANGVTLTGNLVADSTGTLTITLQNQTTLSSILQQAALTMDSSSIWRLTGNSALISLSDASGISGLSITNIIGNGYNATYDASLAANQALGGQTYSLVNGKQLDFAESRRTAESVQSDGCRWCRCSAAFLYVHLTSEAFSFSNSMPIIISDHRQTMASRNKPFRERESCGFR